ncbi:hypothetical protein KL921_003131 [Ogataea angusta]|uniref:Mitochondrial carrier n=1 Tax=Pichia angusta TaxID=870730 RepID=A0ABQ7RU09_PICAN|nr:hypothetical protein KL921_003131 [Ogataea angusta]KAG7829272.1 hypothetical protein KL920_003065 [Ogataea angusta]KAG7833927.1 hypothetical protein KL943_003223 [Ogataea angusta]KAG7840186.1 hypothetical protein KL942_002985 [Ogataea angusta]KAG7847515.1 hypothetical protein KL940_003851 [Ogataea angusta]
MSNVLSTSNIAVPDLETHNRPSSAGGHIPQDAPSRAPETYHPRLLHCFLAGGIGGMVGDSLMHSLDTVKTRQQGAPNVARYRNTVPAYLTLLREEGLMRGLYGGYGAAMLGSFPSAACFFITYESTKRIAIDEYGLNETFTYLGAGFLGDFVSSIFYVPSEVLKTRLQLQGRYNNTVFRSGYNYTGTFNAISTIIRTEGWQTLFYGYKATLVRDLPFSSLQFVFYEKFRQLAYQLSQRSADHDPLSLSMELLTGAAAGGLAGTLTTPLDVIKTRMQTQNKNATPHDLLTSSSILRGLLTVYRNQGVVGLFSGVGPRFIWTSVQSSVMLLLYQFCLRALSTGELTFA